MPPGDAGADVTAVDLREATHALLLARERNGPTSWFSRHQAWTIALASGLVGVVSWGVNRWSSERIAEAVAPIHEEQESKLEAVKTDVAELEASTDARVELLQQNDEDFVDYVQAADRYEQRVLEDVAEKLRVKTPDRADVDRAAKRLDAIKERRRAQ